MEQQRTPQPPSRGGLARWGWPLLAAVVVGAAAWSLGLLAPLAGALGAGLLAGLAVARLSGRDRTTRQLVAALIAGQRGEDAPRPAVLDDDLAALVALWDGQAQALRLQQDTLRQTASSLRGLADGIAPALQLVEGTQVSGRTRVLAAQDVLRSAATQVDSLGHRLDEQQRLSEESQSCAVELDTTNGQVSQHVRELAESVDETAASIEEMTYSIKEVARNIEDLSLAAEQTATSMNQMDTSISEVESNVQVTSQLADEVARDAGKGAEAVQRTLDGIQKIQATVTTASTVISSLGERIREIGNILGVIEEVAEQTNLLALNAAIIAAQAGEHGRGFAVVAEEIKDLSEKTGASTKEISTLIKSIQDESRNAVEAIAVGERHVHVGVALSREAEGALAKILDSSAKSTQRFRTIAAATGEQARGSKIVADAVERIARSVQQVAAATAEQARGSEQLMRSAERIKTVTHQVERTSREQGLGSRQFLQQAEAMGATLQSLREHEQVLRAAVGDLRAQVSPLVDDSSRSDASIEAVRELAPRLRAEAERLTARAAARITTLPS